MEQNLFWLSFVHHDRPKGNQFVGAAVMRADDMEQATRRAWAKGINPGGEVMGFMIPDQYRDRVPPDWIERPTLISRQECDELERKFSSD